MTVLRFYLALAVLATFPLMAGALFLHAISPAVLVTQAIEKEFPR